MSVLIAMHIWISVRNVIAKNEGMRMTNSS